MIQRSEFFRAARSDKWIQDDPTRPISLKDEDPEVFAAYAHAVQFGCIRVKGLHVYDNGCFEDNAAFEATLWGPLDAFKAELSNVFNTIELKLAAVHLVKFTERYMCLIKLYILSNMLLDHEIANMAVNEVIRTRDLVMWIPLFPIVDLLYSSTVAGDGMRNLICDYYVACPDTTELSERDRSADFLKDLVFNMIRHERNPIIKQQKPSFPAVYCANWTPSQGPHRYHTGPRSEGDKLP
jgi:hypothetical protein